MIRALNDERSIVRTWLMRGTLHLVASPDLYWMLALFGPVFSAANRTRHAQLGLNEKIKSRGASAIRHILSSSGPLTRYEIVDRLRGYGVSLDPRTQAPIHLIQVAALQGILCLGPDRPSGEPTYVLIDDWLGAVRPREIETPLVELGRRFFAAYGPATLEDLVTWSGLPVERARSALAAAMSELVEVSVGGRSAYLGGERLGRVASQSTVRLLPAFDTYFFGYRSRSLAIPPKLQHRLQRGGGWLHPAVVVNGRAIAAWSLKRTGNRGHVYVEPVGPLSAGIRAGIADEVDDMARFLDIELKLAYS